MATSRGRLLEVCGNPLLMNMLTRPLNSSDILENCLLSTLWQQIGEMPFSVTAYNEPVHKTRSIKKLFTESVVEVVYKRLRPDR